jgi:hypothetical protein
MAVDPHSSFRKYLRLKAVLEAQFLLARSISFIWKYVMYAKNWAPPQGY